METNETQSFSYSSTLWAKQLFSSSAFYSAWQQQGYKLRLFVVTWPDLRLFYENENKRVTETSESSELWTHEHNILHPFSLYLTIIPRARMGSESIAHEAEGRMGYWLRGREYERDNCFSKIQLVGQKYRDKTTLASKTRFSRHCFGFQSRRFSLLVGYNI